MKTIIQSDFDGTITPEDVSFMILDTFGSKDWRQGLEDYKNGKITVADFNTQAFSTVKADEQTLVNFVRQHSQVRPGFKELLDFCRRHDIGFVIVSNGLDFYIKTVLDTIGVNGIDIHAATTRFTPEGIDARYLGPDGTRLNDKFKDAYLRYFLEKGYRVIYAGNGPSDLSPARDCCHIFATDNLLDSCQDMNLVHTPFEDLNEVVRGLEHFLGHTAS